MNLHRTRRVCMAILVLLLTCCGSGTRDVASAPAAAVSQGGASGQGGAVSEDLVGEPPANPPPATVPEGDVSDATLAQLGACWFTNPYDYMFGAGPGVVVNGATWTKFLGGINGLLYYGDLNSCVAEQLGGQASSYSDNKPFAKLSGHAIYSDRMDDTKPFGFYNPELVKWGHENLIPPKDLDIGGSTAQQIYDVVFSRFFRMMTEAYLWLVDSGKVRQETEAYWKMATGSNPDGLTWLQNRYGSALPNYDVGYNYTFMTPWMAIGFWLRRDLDGTADELWTGLRKVMNRFDPQFYDGLHATYASPDIAW